MGVQTGVEFYYKKMAALIHVRRVARKSSISNTQACFKNTSVFRRRISTRRSRKNIRIVRTASYQFKSHTRSPYLIPQRNELHSSLTFNRRLCFFSTDKDTGLTSSINREGEVLKSNDSAVADESEEPKTDEVRIFSGDFCSCVWYAVCMYVRTRVWYVLYVPCFVGIACV